MFSHKSHPMGGKFTILCVYSFAFQQSIVKQRLNVILLQANLDDVDRKKNIINLRAKYLFSFSNNIGPSLFISYYSSSLFASLSLSPSLSLSHYRFVCLYFFFHLSSIFMFSLVLSLHSFDFLFIFCFSFLFSLFFNFFFFLYQLRCLSSCLSIKLFFFLSFQLFLLLS